MKRFVGQIFIIIISIHVLLILTDIFYTWTLSQVPVHGISKNQKVDYIIAGDSRTLPLRAPYVSFVTGKKVLNFSSPAYVLDDIIELLYFFFRSGNKADKIVLQVDQKFGSRLQSKKQFIYQPYLFREQWIQARYPFRFYAENNKNITPSLVLNSFKKILSGFDFNEYLDTVNIKMNHYVVNPRLDVDFTQDHLRIENIITLKNYLLQNGVQELILYSPPYIPAWGETQADQHHFKKAIAKSGIKYYDLSNIYKDTIYFKDQLHVRNSKDMEYTRLVSSILFKVP